MFTVTQLLAKRQDAKRQDEKTSPSGCIVAKRQSNLQFAASCYLSDVSLFQRISTCPSRHSPCKTRAHRRHIQCNWGDQFKSASLTGGLSE